jgi:RNA binding exosome subunit
MQRKCKSELTYAAEAVTQKTSTPSKLTKHNQKPKSGRHDRTFRRPMSSKPPIAYVDIRVFSHATENQDKVETAVKNLLTEALAENLLFQKSPLEGHHGNPITLFTTRLEDKKQIPMMLKKIGDGLSALDKEALNNDIKLHLEKGNLYLRLDKQSASLGTAKFTQNDPIHLKIHFKDKTEDEIVEFCKTNGLLP